MATFDIFNNDAFSMVSLIEAIEKVPYQPSFIRDLNLFLDKPVMTRNVYVEERDGVLNLIQTSPRGAPLPQRKTEQRSARSFDTVRIAKGDRLNASEISGIRAFGSETELMMVQQEVMRRMSGPLGMQREVELTWENMMLGATQGIVLDADGSVIINWYDEFGISQPSEIAFDLKGAQAPSTSANGSLVLKPFINKNIIRPMKRASKGAWIEGRTYPLALCGDDFFDELTAHGDVARAYGNWVEKNANADSNAFSIFNWGGVAWVNYRGTDDNSTVAVAPDDAKFFPVNAPGIFVQAWSPGEFFPVLNRPGVPLLPMILPDEKRQAYVDLELYSYPLHICTRPETLLRGRRGS